MTRTIDTTRSSSGHKRPFRTFSRLAVATAVALSATTHGLSMPKTRVSSPTSTTALFESPVTTSLDSMLDSSDNSNNKNDFDMHVGRALDTLRRDYPDLLTEQPDFGIYDPNIRIVDPSGVHVRGLGSYKNAFLFLHGLVRVIYCPEKSGLQFRMVYDQTRRAIRIHWNAKVVPREIFGGTRTTLHVDGISVYELSTTTGNITEHRIEHLLMNSRPVMPKEGVIAALQKQSMGTVPSLNMVQGGNVVEFRPASPLERSPSSLFAMEANSDDANIDWEAFENKNKSRKKFGLSPLSPQEFAQVEQQVQQMDVQQRQRIADAAASSQKQKQDKKPNVFDKLFGQVLEDTCESNFDCQRPEICCDFGFKKMCCSSGMPVGYDQMKLVPVAAETTTPHDSGKFAR